MRPSAPPLLAQRLTRPRVAQIWTDVTNPGMDLSEILARWAQKVVDGSSITPASARHHRGSRPEQPPPPRFNASGVLPSNASDVGGRRQLESIECFLIGDITLSWALDFAASVRTWLSGGTYLDDIFTLLPSLVAGADMGAASQLSMMGYVRALFKPVVSSNDLYSTDWQRRGWIGPTLIHALALPPDTWIWNEDKPFPYLKAVQSIAALSISDRTGVACPWDGDETCRGSGCKIELADFRELGCAGLGLQVQTLLDSRSALPLSYVVPGTATASEGSGGIPFWSHPYDDKSVDGLRVTMKEQILAPVGLDRALRDLRMPDLPETLRLPDLSPLAVAAGSSAAPGFMSSPSMNDEIYSNDIGLGLLSVLFPRACDPWGLQEMAPALYQRDPEGNDFRARKTAPNYRIIDGAFGGDCVGAANMIGQMQEECCEETSDCSQLYAVIIDPSEKGECESCQLFANHRDAGGAQPGDPVVYTVDAMDILEVGAFISNFKKPNPQIFAEQIVDLRDGYGGQWQPFHTNQAHAGKPQTEAVYWKGTVTTVDNKIFKAPPLPPLPSRLSRVPDLARARLSDPAARSSRDRAACLARAGAQGHERQGASHRPPMGR